MATKKVKIKVKKRKANIKRIFIAIVIITGIAFLVSYYLHLPVKNIYITGNKILSDKEIITMAELDDYPAYFNTYFTNIKSKLLDNDYIKNATIKRKIINKIYIYNYFIYIFNKN